MLPTDARRVYRPIQPPRIPTWPACWEMVRGSYGLKGIYCWPCGAGVEVTHGLDGSVRRECRCSVQTVPPRRG